MILPWSIAIMALAGLLIVGNYYVFISLRQQIIAREEAQLQQIVNVSGAAVDHMFATTKDALESIRVHVGPGTSATHAHELLKITADASPFIRALSIISADGYYLHSSRSFPPPTVNLARSPVVSHFINPPSYDSYFVSAPTRNTIDNEWQVLSGIPVRDDRGDITQVIAAVIDTKFVYSELLSRNTGEIGDVLLVDSEYRLIAGNPWRDEQIGINFKKMPIFKMLETSNSLAASGVVEGFNYPGPVIAAARWLKDGRFALSTSRTVSSVLADWRVLSRVVGAVSAAIFVLLILTGWVSVRGAVRRQEQSNKLLETEQRFRAMVDGVSDHAIYMMDIQGRITNWNNGAALVTGYDAESAIGQNFRMFYPAEEQQKGVPEKALAVAAKDGVRKGEGWRVRANGERFWASVVTTAVRERRGELLGFAEVTRDITEAHANRLELRVAKERAERANAAKTDFLANMSHEIRTPLNGIIGYSDLALEDTSLLPETRQNIARVFEASNALRVIINDVLDFSKIEARGVELEMAPFSVRELIDSCASLVKLPANEKGLELTAHVDDDVPQQLMGDAPRLRQVLINLLNNAVKFTADGTVKLTLSCTPQADHGLMLHFAVIDTGIGITGEDQLKLFQRFNQADSSISRQYGGTGLGLAITQRIVEAMKGKVEIESVIGKGSTFKFSILLSAALGPATVLPTHITPDDRKKSLRVLVVDDVEMNRDLCKAILTRAGHRVTVTVDGPHAVTLIAREQFDVVLMDIQMPGMDGMETTRQIRLLEHGKGALPIVALTANVLADQVERFRIAGMVDYVTKPINKSELLAKLSKAAGLTPVATHDVAPEAAILNIETLDELRHFTSDAKVASFARDLQVAVTNFPESWPEAGDREALRAAAHMAVALAGQLGFVALAEACRALEVACQSGLPLPPALGRLQVAGAAARAAIDGIAAKAA